MELTHKIKLCQTYNQLLLKSQNKTLNIDLEQSKYILTISKEIIDFIISKIENYQTKNFSRLSSETSEDDTLVESVVYNTSTILYKILDLYYFIKEKEK